MDHDTEVDAVRAIEDAYDRAWNRGDLTQVIDCLCEDVVLVNPTGQVAVGREEAREVLSVFLSTDAEGTNHRSELTRLSFVTEDVGVVDGLATIARGDNALMTHPFTDVLKRSQGRWRVAHIRAYTLAE